MPRSGVTSTVAEPPELVTFAIANLVTFGLGSVLTVLSFYAYRASGYRRSFRDSTAGFALLTLGGLVEPAYQLGLKGDYHLAGRELLALQSLEAALTALGLGLLFYAIYRHDRRRRSRAVADAGEGW